MKPERTADAGRLSQWLSERRLHMVRPHLRGSVLDFGCGQGSLSQCCTPDNYLGYDIRPDMIEIARRAWPGYRFEMSLPEGMRFDTVASVAMIEHVDDPGSFLKQFADLAKPGGRIVLTTPHPQFEWVHGLGVRLHLFSAHAEEDHEDLIDRSTMDSLLRGTGSHLTTYRRFMLGANQLFVIQSDRTS